MAWLQVVAKKYKQRLTYPISHGTILGMTRELLEQMIDVAAGRIPADVILKEGKIIDVYGHKVIQGNVVITQGYIAAVEPAQPGAKSRYKATKEINLQGAYVAPGFIDSHIHIESSHLSPEEFGRLSLPHGTTTVIADPHEIVNVAGVKGFQYMLDAANGTKLDIKYMMPSCVPATPFETSGATIEATDMVEPLKHTDVLGLGEFMNYPGIIHKNPQVLDKILLAHQAGKLIDGHSPGVEGAELAAYRVAGIHTDHECSTLEEMRDRLAMGVYVLLRQGTACKDLATLLPGVTPENARRCLLCSDDRNVESLLEVGHLEEHLAMCVAHGIDPITAIQMATLNAAECFRLYDRGAVASGKLATLTILDNLKDFTVSKVIVKGEVVAEGGIYLPKTMYQDSSAVQSSVRVADFSQDRLQLKLATNKAHVIALTPGGVVTEKRVMEVSRDGSGNFIYDATRDICKIAVVERHRLTGNVAVALLHGYGIKSGAIAQSLAHDSHNILVAGVDDKDMAYAVEELIAQGGGLILVKQGEVIERVPMPIAGLMSDQPGEVVAEKLKAFDTAAYESLGISRTYEPVMTLGFMSLPVIPEIKLTDKGLFDVTQFSYIPVDVE